MEAREYQIEAGRTLRINWENKEKRAPDIAVLGMIGETGSIASAIKKHIRDEGNVSSFNETLIEELGDLLWYVTTVATRFGVRFDQWPKAENVSTSVVEGLYKLYENIKLLENKKDYIYDNRNTNLDELKTLIYPLLINIQDIAAFQSSTLAHIANYNCNKTLSHWGRQSGLPARCFDDEFPSYERLPRKFEIDIKGIGDGKTIIMQMNGMNLGDRITDNNHQDDGYRFHDVFHIAGAAMLGWSPVFRGLLKVKRKSAPKIDEVEDGARASIIEEAIINHVYDYARPHFLENVRRVDSDLIKRIQSLVQGYEVSDCEAWEWQEYILKSYEIFRAFKQNGSGKLIVNAEMRSIEYLPLS